MSQAKGKITIDELAAMLGIETSDRYCDRNEEYVDSVGEEAYTEAWKEALEEETPEPEALVLAEDARMAGMEEANAEVYSKWQEAVHRVAEDMANEHGLEFIPLRGSNTEFRWVPKTSWDDAAREILKTVNGVGYFYFSSLREAKDSGPYTSREFVLRHLHYMRKWPEVYGDGSIQRRYERAL